MPRRASGLCKSPSSYDHNRFDGLPAQSNDAGKLVSDLHPQLKGIVDLPLQPMSDISEFSARVDVVFWLPPMK